MNSHVSLQPDPKSQPPIKLNHTLLLIKARIAWQNQSQGTFSSLFPDVRENRSTRPVPFSLSLQTSGGRDAHACYVDLNPTLQKSNQILHTTQRGFSTPFPPITRSLQLMPEGFSTSLPPIKTLKSMHRGFPTPFPHGTKSSYATNERFSTPGTRINRRYAGFSRINPGRYTPIASPIAGLGSDSSPPEASIAA